MRTIEPLPFQVLDADRSVVLVEQHPGRKRVELEPEPVGVACRDIEDPLTRAVAPVIARRERGVADALGAVADDIDVVRIANAAQQPAQRAVVFRDRGARRRRGQAQQVVVAHGVGGDRLLGVQPALPAMAGAIDPEPRQLPLHRPVPAVLEPPEITMHAPGRPGRIAGQPRDRVPVGLVRIDQDHRVVGGAAAERASARVEHAIDGPAVQLAAVFGVPPLRPVVVVVPDEKIPPHRLVLRGERMERGDVVVVGQPVLVRLPPDAAGQAARVAAGFEQEDLVACLGQPCGDRAPAGARADDDVVVVGILAQDARSHRRRDLRASSGTRSARAFADRSAPAPRRTGRSRSSGRD